MAFVRVEAAAKAKAQEQLARAVEALGVEKRRLFVLLDEKKNEAKCHAALDRRDRMLGQQLELMDVKFSDAWSSN